MHGEAHRTDGPAIIADYGYLWFLNGEHYEFEDWLEAIGVDASIITPREGVGLHKVVISKNGNRSRKSVLKYASPEYGTGHNAIWIQTKDKKEAEEIINYYNSPEITRLVLSLNETSPANGVGFWSKIPHYKHKEKVKKIYAKYFS